MTVEKKKLLRKSIAARRAEAHGTVDPSSALAMLDATLRNHEGPYSFYWPIRSEIDPRPVMEALSKTHDVCLPLTHGHSALSFLRWVPGQDMDIDEFGVAVPAESEPLVPQTLVVPMLGFDRRGHRLGYGAGHYDRTLAGLRASGPLFAVGFAYSVQEEDELPIEPTDQPLDAIITEKGSVRFS